MTDKYTRFLLTYRQWILAFTALVTLFFAWHAKDVKILSALENMIPEDDPHLIDFKKLNNEFGGDLLMMVAIQADEIFTPGMLGELQSLTRAFEELPQVDRVISLTNATQISSEGDELRLTPFIEEIPDGPEATQRLKAQAVHDPLFTQYLIHPVEPATMIYVSLKPHADLWLQQKERDATVKETKRILDERQGKGRFTYQLAGRVPLEYELDKKAQVNQMVSSLLMMLMIAVILYFLFRDFVGMLACLINIALAYVWTLGFIGLTSLPLNFVTSLLPALILIISVMDCIHIYAVYRVEDSSLPKETRLGHTMRHMLKPCLFTALTTIFGFGSLIFSPMEVVRHFGLFAVFGIAAALVLAVGPFSLLITLTSTKPQKDAPVSPLMGRFIEWVIRVNEKHWKKACALGLAACLFFGWGLTCIITETKPVTYFAKDSAVRKAYEFMDEKFNGSTTVDTVIHGPKEIFTDPAALRMVDDFSTAFGLDPRLSRMISVVDYVKKTNMVLHSNDPQYHKIPEERGLLAQIYFLLDSDKDFKKLIKDDPAAIRVHSRVRAIGSRVGMELMEKGEALAKAHILPPLHFTFTGSNIVWMNMEAYLVKTLMTSFPVSFLLTILLLIFVLKSYKWAVISMVPNVLPVLVTFGLMGLTGIRLNMVTAMVASITLGIVIDDTVHLSLFLREQTCAGVPAVTALNEAARKLGVAVISSSLILTLGFWTFVFTDFNPTIEFGLLSGATVLVALMAELFLMPGIVRMCQGWLGVK